MTMSKMITVTVFGVLLTSCATNTASAPEVSTSQADASLSQDASNKGNSKEAEQKITDRRHPDFIKCRKEAVMGSMSRKIKTCMTNKEWAAFREEGKKRSNEMLEDIQPGFMMGE